MAGISLKDKVRGLCVQRKLGSGVTVPLHRKKSVVVVWAYSIIRMPQGRLLLEVFCARPVGRKPWVKPRNRRKEYIPSGLVTSLDPPGGDGECCWGKGCLGFPPEPVASTT